jgi:peptidoglycan/LPS O-acetylase OafA/YrhL
VHVSLTNMNREAPPFKMPLNMCLACITICLSLAFVSWQAFESNCNRWLAGCMSGTLALA